MTTLCWQLAGLEPERSLLGAGTSWGSRKTTHWSRPRPQGQDHSPNRWGARRHRNHHLKRLSWWRANFYFSSCVLIWVSDNIFKEHRDGQIWLCIQWLRKDWIVADHGIYALIGSVTNDVIRRVNVKINQHLSVKY